MPNSRDSRHLLRACKDLFDGAGLAAHAQLTAPHLYSWLKGAYRPPAEVLLEIADIVIQRLLDAKPPGKESAALEEWRVSDSIRHRQLKCVRTEAEVHRLETVLTRAKAIALCRESNGVRARSQALRSRNRRAVIDQTVEQVLGEECEGPQEERPVLS